MASGSVKSQQVCREADEIKFTATLPASSRTQISAASAGYTIPSGYVGATAGITGDTDLTKTLATLINDVSPRATGTSALVGIRNNASSTSTTKEISVKVTFIKSEFVDDRR